MIGTSDSGLAPFCAVSYGALNYLLSIIHNLLYSLVVYEIHHYPSWRPPDGEFNLIPV